MVKGIDVIIKRHTSVHGFAGRGFPQQRERLGMTGGNVAHGTQDLRRAQCVQGTTLEPSVYIDALCLQTVLKARQPPLLRTGCPPVKSRQCSRSPFGNCLFGMQTPYFRGGR